MFDTRPTFRGKVLAAYIKDRNPLVSGFLLGAQVIEGKAAALDANYGSGHVILLGFRPQWRGQSHGTYKFLFNALYFNSSMAPESPSGGGRGGRGGGNPQQSAWRREADAVKTELTRLLDLNRAYFTARGPAAAEPGQAVGSGSGRVPARPHAAARRSARAGGRCGRGSWRSDVVGAAQEAGRRPAHQGFQRIQDGRPVGAIQTGGGAMRNRSQESRSQESEWKVAGLRPAALGVSVGCGWGGCADAGADAGIRAGTQAGRRFLLGHV